MLDSSSSARHIIDCLLDWYNGKCRLSSFASLLGRPDYEVLKTFQRNDLCNALGEPFPAVTFERAVQIVTLEIVLRNRQIIEKMLLGKPSK